MNSLKIRIQNLQILFILYIAYTFYLVEYLNFWTSLYNSDIGGCGCGNHGYLLGLYSFNRL